MGRIIIISELDLGLSSFLQHGKGFLSPIEARLAVR